MRYIKKNKLLLLLLHHRYLYSWVQRSNKYLAEGHNCNYPSGPNFIELLNRQKIMLKNSLLSCDMVIWLVTLFC